MSAHRPRGTCGAQSRRDGLDFGREHDVLTPHRPQHVVHGARVAACQSRGQIGCGHSRAAPETIIARAPVTAQKQGGGYCTAPLFRCLSFEDRFCATVTALAAFASYCPVASLNLFGGAAENGATPELSLLPY